MIVSASASFILDGSSSSSSSKKPVGDIDVSPQIRAICALRRFFSLPGNGGYDGISASKSPVKNLLNFLESTTYVIILIYMNNIYYIDFMFQTSSVVTLGSLIHLHDSMS